MSFSKLFEMFTVSIFWLVSTRVFECIFVKCRTRVILIHNSRSATPTRNIIIYIKYREF